MKKRNIKQLGAFKKIVHWQIGPQELSFCSFFEERHADHKITWIVRHAIQPLL